MRSLVRIVAPVVAAAAIALAGSSSALASSRAPHTWSPPPASAPAAPHTPVTGSPPPASAPAAKDASPGWAIDDAWCIGDYAFMTCFEVTGRVQFLIGEGTSGLIVNAQEHAAHYEQGVLLAETTELSHERFAVNANGTYTVHVVTHTRVDEGDVTCSFQEVFRIVDFELVTDHDAGTCA
jgi:hypothetical protein